MLDTIPRIVTPEIIILPEHIKIIDLSNYSSKRIITVHLKNGLIVNLGEEARYDRCVGHSDKNNKKIYENDLIMNMEKEIGVVKMTCSSRWVIEIEKQSHRYMYSVGLDSAYYWEIVGMVQE